MHVCTHLPVCLRSEDNLESVLSFHHMVLGIEFRLSDLVARAYIGWAISLAHNMTLKTTKTKNKNQNHDACMQLQHLRGRDVWATLQETFARVSTNFLLISNYIVSKGKTTSYYSTIVIKCRFSFLFGNVARDWIQGLLTFSSWEGQGHKIHH